jgi:hypothetical protein
VAAGTVEPVRRLLGHRDLASTTRYVHATKRDLMAAVAVLPGNSGKRRIAFVRNYLK